MTEGKPTYGTIKINNSGRGISELHVYHLAREDSELHFHKVIELGLCTSGHGSAETDGIAQTFAAGDYQIVFPFQNHRNRAESDDCVWNWVFLDPWMLAAHTGISQLLFTELMEKIRLYGIIRKEAHPALCSRLDELLTAAGSDAPYRNERICAMLTLLLIDMAALPDGTAAPVTIPPRFDAIAPALILVGERLAAGELPSVQALADACRMPLSSFRRTFTAVIGVSPKRHITICAVQKAAMLLLTTDKNVTEIAGLSGFPEISTFNRAFRSVLGTAPADYREAQNR